MSKIITVVSAGLLLAISLPVGAQSVQLKPGIKLEDIEKQNPTIRQIQKHNLQPRLKLPPRATPRSASLSVYAVPFDSWCRNHPGGTTEGRISVNVSYPREADGSSVPATLVVFADRTHRFPVSLGVGTFMVTSGVFQVTAGEVCDDRCVDYQLVPRDDTSEAWIDTRVRQACIP